MELKPLIASEIVANARTQVATYRLMDSIATIVRVWLEGLSNSGRKATQRDAKRLGDLLASTGPDGEYKVRLDHQSSLYYPGARSTARFRLVVTCVTSAPTGEPCPHSLCFSCTYFCDDYSVDIEQAMVGHRLYLDFAKAVEGRIPDVESMVARYNAAARALLEVCNDCRARPDSGVDRVATYNPLSPYADAFLAYELERLLKAGR